jgi:hypothetical protein
MKLPSKDISNDPSFQAKNFVPLALRLDRFCPNADELSDSAAENMSRAASPHLSHSREKCARNGDPARGPGSPLLNAASQAAQAG